MEFPMVALRNARLKYHEKKPKERFNKGDRIRAFAGKHAGRVGTIKKVGNSRLTMDWDDGADGKFCEASHAELLRVYQEATAMAPTETTTTGSGNDNNDNEPELTHEGVYNMIENRLNDLTMDLTAMLRMRDNPNEAWREVKIRIDTMLVWHQDDQP